MISQDIIELLNKKYSSSEKNAVRRSIHWDLSRQDFFKMVMESKGRCALTGIRFRITREKGRQPFAPSIDRIDSTKGYTAKNCRLVCVIVNYALNEFGDDVFKEMIYSAHSYLKEKLEDEQVNYSNSVDIERLESSLADAHDQISFMREEIRQILNTINSRSEQNIVVNNNVEEFITTEKMAEILGMNPASVRVRLCRKGDFFGIAPKKLPNGRLLWCAQMVRTIIDSDGKLKNTDIADMAANAILGESE